MDPPQKSEYMNANTILVITPTGKMIQLFTPIRAVCNTAVAGIPVGTTVFIEAVTLHKEHILCYRITGIWFVFWCFSLK